MFAMTLRKWFGVQSNYKDDYHNRVIRGNWLGRRYELTVGGKHNHWCTYYQADANGTLMIRFAKIALWIATRKKKKEMRFFEEEGAPSWGWNVMDGELALYLGNRKAKKGECVSMRSRSKYIPLPGTWRCHRRYQLAQFSADTPARWADVTEQPIPKDYHRVWVQSFIYVTKQGEEQAGVATMTLDKRVYRRAWLQWLPWERVKRSIRVEFSRELGVDNGGWKGGVLGASITLLDDRETPPQALNRIIDEQRYG